jgi:hypothetical protein
MPMPRNSTTTRTSTGRRGSISARRKPAAGKPGRQVAAEQPAQPKQAEQHTPIDVDDELYEEIELDDAGPSWQVSSEARKRVEILREERLLQQALYDTFDL